MIMARMEDWNGELRAWLAPFLDKLGHKARRRMCPLYVAGLIGPGDRKSIQSRAYSRWQSGLRQAITISYAILLLPACGMRRRWKESSSFKRTGSSAERCGAGDRRYRGAKEG